MTLRQIYAKAPADRECLRVGLALDSLTQPGWVSVMLEALAETGAAKVVVILRLPADRPAPRTDCLAYRLYAWADEFYFSRRAAGGGALTRRDIGPLVAGLPSVKLAATPAGEIQPGDLAPLRQQHLDVLLHLGSSPPPAGLAEAVGHGVWHCCHDDDLSLFRGLYDGSATAEAQLRLLAAGGQRILCRGTSSASSQSLCHSRRNLLLMAALFPARAARALQRHGATAIAEESEPPVPLEAGAPVGRRQPTNLDVLRLVAKIFGRWIRYRWQNRRGQWWFVALRPRRPASPAGEREGEGLDGFRPLPLPRRRFHADPFLFEQDGATHLFFEDVDVALKRGVISHCRLHGDGQASPAQVVLDRPYHLSYPFVFRWRDDVFMLPETGQNRTIELYRAEEFPLRWRLDRVLLEGWSAADATLHCDEHGRWWMFATVDECGGDTFDRLFLFQAETPLGPWQPHPANPVVCDVRHARPGGRLFRRGGRLIRPAQDCASHYGSGLWLMEVLELNETCYRERPLRRLGPEWLAGNRCLHHLDSTGRFEVIDGMRLRPTEA